MMEGEGACVDGSLIRVWVNAVDCMTGGMNVTGMTVHSDTVRW